VHFARAEDGFRTALRAGRQTGVMQNRIETLYRIVGRPEDAAAAFEVARAADGVDPDAARRVARAYVALGRCPDGERLLAKVDRQRGFTGPSDETRAILAACAAPK
jgi:hypothetical protein